MLFFWKVGHTRKLSVVVGDMSEPERTLNAFNQTEIDLRLFMS